MRLLEIRYGGFRFRIAWPFFLQPETKYRAGVRLDGRAKITQSEIAIVCGRFQRPPAVTLWLERSYDA